MPLLPPVINAALFFGRMGSLQHRGKLAGFIFHGRSTGGAQERGLECLIEVTSNLGHTLVAELPEEG